ncbi:MAG TPA: methionyl-tRNA formyltransferase [Candidatus Omnitrophota bacterium]|nr:methionyl-tRNA formyltransferase [Candidatus Omnitrophota bacterium]HQJ16222.1 methionyl-tRNA formyltransferase [Candidatus Omnitrophota bacterium]
MNIVYLGTGDFGRPSLEGLVESSHTVRCVVSQPDKPRNRGMRLEPAAMKKAAAELGLEVYQPEDINSRASVEYLKGLRPDLLVVIAYGQKLSQPVLDIPRLAAVNVHASLLPAYRGAAPVNWAIIRGEKTTGVTLMKLSTRMDAGPIILQKTAPILDSDTSLTLSRKLSLLAAEALDEGIGLIGKGTYDLMEQDESKATYAPKLKKTDGSIDWNRPCNEIVNRVRGCVPWPGAHTLYKGKVVKIHGASMLQDASAGNHPAGAIIGISRQGIAVAARPGAVLIHLLQMQGKRQVSADEFIGGYRAKPGDIFG